MSSRRRNSKKNLGNSISDIQRRIRRMERKPIRTRLQNRVIKGSAIAPGTITPEEVSFGTTEVTSDNPADVIDNPKKGTTVIDPDTGAQKVYSESLADYIPVTDPTAQATADSKKATYYQDAQPTGATYQAGDMWVDTNDDNKLYTWSGSSWVLTQDSATAYDAALASLQPSANTIVNASNQITAVNTNGITVYSGSSPTTGARIVMNSAGLAGFNSSSTGAGNGATFSISASTGDAIFSGTVNATGGTFTGYVTAGTARFGVNVDSTDDGIWINSNNYWYDTGAFKVGDGSESMSYSSAGGLVVTGEINANSGTFTGNITSTATITGGTLRTAGSGRSVSMTSSNPGVITFYDPDVVDVAYISSADRALYIYGPGTGAKMQLYSSTAAGGLVGLAAIQAAVGSGGDVTLTTDTNTFRIDGTTTAVTLTNATPVDTFGLRNIRGRLTADFNPATNTSGTDGDIVVVYS